MKGSSPSIGALASAITFVTLPRFGDILGLRAPVNGQRTADVVTLLEFPLRVPTNIAFIALKRLYKLAFRSHGDPRLVFSEQARCPALKAGHR